MNKAVKKTLKIGGITLASILGVIIVIFLLLSWTVFSPKRLTKTANQVIDKYLPCNAEVDKVGLSLVSSYPFLAFEFYGLTVFDEMEESASDTLLHSGTFYTFVDMKALLKERKIIVEHLFTNDLQANLFISESGATNLDIFLPADSAVAVIEPEETEASTDFELYVDLRQIRLQNISATYIDNQSNISASIDGLGIDVSGILDGTDMHASINAGIDKIVAQIADSTSIDASIDGIEFRGNAKMDAEKITLGGNLNTSLIAAAIDDMNASLKNTGMTINNAVYQTSNGNIQLNAIVNGESVNFNADGISASLEEFLMSVADVTINEEMINADNLKFALSNLDVQMQDSVNGDINAAVSALNVDMLAATNQDMNNISGSLSAKGDGIQFNMGGAAPMAANLKDLSFVTDLSLKDDKITANPYLATSSLHFALDGDTYVNNWPISVSLPVVADTAITNIAINRAYVKAIDKCLNFSANANLISNGDIKGNANIEMHSVDMISLMEMIPESLKYLVEGIKLEALMDTKIDIDGGILANGEMMLNKANAILALTNLDAAYNDSIFAESGFVWAGITYPGSQNSKVSADITLKATDLNAKMIDSTNIDAYMNDFVAEIEVADFMDTITAISAKADINVAMLKASMDTMNLYTENAALSATVSPNNNKTMLMVNLDYDKLNAGMGSMLSAQTGITSLLAMAVYDDTKEDLLLQWNPVLQLSMEDASLDLLKEPVEMPYLELDFSLGQFNINDSRLQIGNSDIMLWGNVYNIGAYVEKTGMLTGELFLESDYADVTELLALINDFTVSSESADTISSVTVTESAGSDTVTIADPFMVPEGIDLTLYTNLSEINFNDHTFNNVGGDVTIRDGVIVLQELGFSSNSAEMQLTAIYETPARDDLYVGLDFHLLDIQIDELIDLIPSIDSIVPMLKSFDGEAQFHLAAETNLKADYMPKMPTLIGAAAIEGKDLVIMDSEVFDGIKRKLLMSKNAENKIDSMSVEMQVLRNKVDLYPFLIHMDKYQAVIAGRHNINKDLDCNYHVSLTDCPLPIRLGVNVGGSLNDIAEKPLKHIKVGKCQYKKMFKPEKRGLAEERTLQMKKVISDTLKENVR
ncbi:MAG: hypothetical protein IKT80_06845 [Bacteroidaceae bacterium]|nr:hypothetical protein [Bacteroidaceae bacterium]